MIYDYLPIYNKHMHKFKGRKREAKKKKRTCSVSKEFLCLSKNSFPVSTVLFLQFIKSYTF